MGLACLLCVKACYQFGAEELRKNTVHRVSYNSHEHVTTRYVVVIVIRLRLSFWGVLSFSLGSFFPKKPGK